MSGKNSEQMYGRLSCLRRCIRGLDSLQYTSNPQILMREKEFGDDKMLGRDHRWRECGGLDCRGPSLSYRLNVSRPEEDENLKDPYQFEHGLFSRRVINLRFGEREKSGILFGFIQPAGGLRSTDS